MAGAAVAEDVTLAYGTHVALAVSSFCLPAGTVTAVIGPNGSGKSTVLNALAGLLEPVAGRLEVLGTTPDRARRKVAYVLQTTKINEALPVTVREVVAMGRYATRGSFGRLEDEDRRAVEAAMERLEITGLARRHVRELSGGERQRVFVAQGLAQDRDLLLLDEPLTGLDLISGQAISSVITEERAVGRTVVMSTHSLGEAGGADHVLLLDRRVVVEGPPEEVLTIDWLSEAYGPRVVRLEGTRIFVDDAAHEPAARRHVHQERSIHVEAPGSDLHGPEEH
jgi:manganese transport system ATP-binding protein